MNYSDYKIEDWVTDQEVIAYANGVPSEKLDQIRSNPEYSQDMDEAIKIIKNISTTTPHVKDEKLEQIFQKVNTTIDTASRPRAKIIRMKWMGIAAAAVAIFVIAMPFFLATEEKLVTTVAEKQQFNLPDSSAVDLNSVSSITYNARSWKKNRYLVLEGEAFFDVEKGSTFMVSSDQGIVTVLGTQFNVRDREGIYEVECLEGKVEVAVLGSETYTLEAGDRLVKTTAQEPKLERNVVQKVNWLHDYVEVKNQKITQVLEEVSRHFDVKFADLDTLGNQSYSGFFSTTSLDSAMQQIFWPLGVEFEIEDNKVIFK